jgi:hypothetical protein
MEAQILPSKPCSGLQRQAKNLQELTNTGQFLEVYFGAAIQIRTGDLILTKQDFFSIRNSFYSDLSYFFNSYQVILHLYTNLYTNFFNNSGLARRGILQELVLLDPSIHFFFRKEI